MWFFVGQKINAINEPDYDKVLTEQEIKKVLDDTIADLGGDRTEYNYTVDDDANSYSVSFENNGLDLRLDLEDTTRWDDETWETLTDDSNVTWDKFIEKQYNKMVKLFSESASLVKSVDISLYEDEHRLSKINGYDVDIGFNDSFEGHPNFMEGVETMIGNYFLRVMVENEQKEMVLRASESKMKVFINNLLDAL